jgi:hypothetical protein
MTTHKIREYFSHFLATARVLVEEEKFRVTFRVHPVLIPTFQLDLENIRPAGIEFAFKPLRLWDYWLLNRANKIILVEVY